MKYSICTPVVYDKEDEDNKIQPRYEMFMRSAKSVVSQTVDPSLYQWVIYDDMCKPDVKEAVSTLSVTHPWIEFSIQRGTEKLGRIAARNAAMKRSRGEWICWLDADDEYSSLYLEAIDNAIKLYPDYKAFNMNHLIFSYDYGVSIRRFLDTETLGGRPFGSGTIGAGAFVFHRSVFEDIGLMPEKGLWAFRDAMFEEFPEVKPFFWNETNKDYNSLGNPWGEDYYYFYRIYKKYKVKYLDTTLYFVHSHYGHRWKEDPDYFVGEEKGPKWRPKVQ